MATEKSKGTVLLGVINARYFIASVSAHHYISKGKLIADGGQPNTPGYAGYTRFNGTEVWARVPETYAELVTNYQTRKQTGIWNKAAVEIQEVEPDTTTAEWVREHTIWGTYGKNGDQPLKYIRLDEAESDHLEAILETQKGISPTTKALITTILLERDSPDYSKPADTIEI